MNTLNNNNQKGEAMTTTATTTTSKKVVRKFHQDPGHGWLCVKIAELEALGIADKITGFSYMRKQSAYLEEDTDYTTYLKMLSRREALSWKPWMAKCLIRIILLEDLNHISMVAQHH
jgi:hypothetical protein